MPLYAFGSNGSGQLGIGHTDDVSKPECSVSTSINDGEIDKIVAGGNHTVVLFKNGICRAFGSNDQQLTNGRYPSGKIYEVSATWSATTYIDREGNISSCGEGNNGELGCGDDQRHTSGEFLCCNASFDSPVKYISSCMAHTVVVLHNGEVWGWGNGRKGQLGEPAESVWKPRKFEEIGFHAVEAVCGKDFTCITGLNGELTVLGLNRNDRFGVKKNAPRAVSGLKAIAASWGSVFILCDNGEILAWGRDDHGQLPPQNLPPIQAIAAGSEHCLALTKSGKVLVWGWGEHGNCGQPTDDNGDVKGHYNEIEVAGRVTKIFAGCATSFIVTVDDEDQEMKVG